MEILSQRIYFRQNVDNQKSSEYLMIIQSAIVDSKLIELDYLSLQDKKTIRIVEPFALYSTQDNWLLIAVCRLRKDFRAFRLDKIQELKVYNEHFEAQKITLQEYFEICRKKSF